MEIAKYNISIENFGELYAGIKIGKISPKEALGLCEEGKVSLSTDERYVALYFALENSLAEFLGLLQEYAGKDGDSITQNEDPLADTAENVPDPYFRIWQLEDLLSISKDSAINTEQKIDRVYDLYFFYNFPVAWNFEQIIRYSLDSNRIIIGDEVLYSNLIHYIEQEILFFQKRSAASR